LHACSSATGALGSWFGPYTPSTQLLTLSAGVSVRRLGRYTRTLFSSSFLVLVSFGSSLDVVVFLALFSVFALLLRHGVV